MIASLSGLLRDLAHMHQARSSPAECCPRVTVTTRSMCVASGSFGHAKGTGTGGARRLGLNGVIEYLTVRSDLRGE